MPRIPMLVVLAAIAAIAIAGAPAARAAPVIEVASFRVQHGDDLRWAAADLDDAAWPRAALHELTAPGGPIWLRAAVIVPPGFAADQPTGVLFAGLASHEVFWDGTRIGGGGTVGHSPASEVPGPVAIRHWLPGQLAGPGRHVIALRLSAFHRNVPVRQPLWLVHVGGYDQLGAASLLYLWIAIASCSGLVLGAVFALVMWFADRAFLHLCALCTTALALLVAELWRPLIGYSYDWHGPRLLVVASLTWLLAILVVAFTVVRFPRPAPPGRRRRSRHRWFVALAAAAMACAWFAPGWDLKAWLMFLVGLGFAFGWTVRALCAGQRGSRSMAVVVATSLVVLIAAPGWFADVSVFVLVDFLLLCLIVPYAIERRRERAHRERALVTAARLETELVRKHLQPHFLMNTLTALSEWIDEDPRIAGEMVGALADELRLLHDILDRSLITMDEELRLCRAHLAIMSRRKACAYHLVTTGIDPRAAIPPAVFHTLVENAVTHGAASSPSAPSAPSAPSSPSSPSAAPPPVELGLTAIALGDRVRYVFEAPLGRPPSVPRGEGAGTRYIRARLAESFGTAWRFTAGPAGSTWRTEIEIPARSS